MELWSMIKSEIETVAVEQGKKLVPLTNESSLVDSGLDSLCFAVLVARLDDKLGLDPFSDTESFQHPVTFGDLVQIYAHAAEQASTGQRQAAAV
jgi:acyl carrier protein